MGTSVMKRSTVVATLVVVVVLLGACASGSDAALRVRNDLFDGNLTVLHPPGCCNYCTSEICPTVCETCNNVIVEPDGIISKEQTLEPKVGPYPLEYLKIQVTDKVYCVAEGDLKYLTSTALLAVGRGDGTDQDYPDSLEARIYNEEVDGLSIYLQLCTALKRSS